MNRLFRFPLLLALALLPTAAFAHTGAGGTHGFSHGFLHPLSGLDHQLAMVMVGVFAWQLGGRAVWLVPTIFVLVMAFGGFLGTSGIPIPYVEVGIALSVVVLGAIVSSGVKAPVAVAMAVVGLFAVFHGHAHGSEMPLDASGLAFAAGFMIATALLHAIGIGLSSVIGRLGETHGKPIYRVAGGLASLAGMAFLAGIL